MSVDVPVGREGGEGGEGARRNDKEVARLFRGWMVLGASTIVGITTILCYGIIQSESIFSLLGSAATSGVATKCVSILREIFAKTGVTRESGKMSFTGMAGSPLLKRALSIIFPVFNPPYSYFL